MYYPPSYLWHFLLQTSIYNFYNGVNFCGKKNCGNFILWELIFADREKNSKNQNPQKFSATRYSEKSKPGELHIPRVLSKITNISKSLGD